MYYSYTNIISVVILQFADEIEILGCCIATVLQELLPNTAK